MSKRLTRETILHFESVMKKYVQEEQEKKRKFYQKEYQKYRNHPSRKAYFLSEKGKIARKKVEVTRCHRVKNFFLSKKEKLDILMFFLDCPEGYQIDHIIPLSKGGHHHLGNLQWLKKEENLKKGSKLEFIPEHGIKCIPTVTKLQRREPSSFSLSFKTPKYRRMRRI